jgi:hypothetical protein
MPPVADRPPIEYSALTTVSIAFVSGVTPGPSIPTAAETVVALPQAADRRLLSSYFQGAVSPELGFAFEEDAFADESVGLLLKPLSFDF